MTTQKTSRPMSRGMAALCAVLAVLQIRPATGAPGDIFTVPAPALNADPPKATDIKDGDASVSTQTGALQYSYPIQVPPGRNGMAPQLALSYSSQAPTYGGIAAGWSLSIPIITEDHSQGRLRTRSSQVEAQQVLFGQDPKQDDRFVSSMAGGRPLVRVTEPTGVAADVYAAYRAQNDSTFTRYERMKPGAPYRWRARTTDGRVLTFGEGSRMAGCHVSDQWAPLTGMIDPFGNEIRYEYNSTVPNECRIVSITWGQNANVPVDDFAQVVFQYEVARQCNGAYTNAQTDYRSGFPIVTGASPLQSITATAYAPGNPSSPVHTRTIYLSYDGESEGCNRPHAPVRLLRSIQEVASGADSPMVSLPPITFEYNSPTVRLMTPAEQPAAFAPWAIDEDSNNLGWGFRRLPEDDRWPTVESMFLDIDGDGLQDLVTNASTHSSPGECEAWWHKNLGPNSSGNIQFELGKGPIALPRLKWHGNTSPPPPDGAAEADRGERDEHCALNGQVTAFRNAYLLHDACHHDPASSCRSASDESDDTRYCDPGGTRCPPDPGWPKVVDGAYRTYLAYRWLDVDSDGLVDLVAAVHGDIDSYDIERGNKPGYSSGEPSMSGIPGLDEWPECGAPADRCKRLESCLDERNARECNDLACTTDWIDVVACVADTVTTGCAAVLMKPASGPEGAPTGDIGVRRHPYERCEGLYPWFIYKNEGNGQFASTPEVKYQPVPLESSSGDSSFGSGVSITAESHAIVDFDGDGWLDAVVRDTKEDEDGNWIGSYGWQVWQGDGTGGFGPERHIFLTRPNAPCPIGIAGTCAFGGNAISGVAGTYSQSVLSLAGLLDVNGDGAQDHWLALLEDGNANVAFNKGDELKLVPGNPPMGERTTPVNLPSYAVKPGNDTYVAPTDPQFPQPGQFIFAGTTMTRNRVVDVDHDGRMDVVSFSSASAWPKVHFNVGGQFIAPGIDYGFGVSGVNIEGLKRHTEALRKTSAFETLQWRLNTDLIDLDGDGIQEGAFFFNLDINGEPVRRFLRARPQSSQPPRLLRAVHNGRGAHTTITYAQMHDDDIVVQDASKFWPDGRPKASPRAQWVVKSLRVDDDIAGTNATTQYKYTHPRYGADDSGRYSFRGFEEVMTTKPGPTGAPDGARTIQRYAYNVDWSGRLVETVVMPSVAEGANYAQTIDTTTWQELSLFGGAIKTYHASVTEHYVCANGQADITCKIAPAGYTRTTSTYTAYPDTPTAGDEQLWLQSGTLLQGTMSAAAEGDRQTATTYMLRSAPTLYLVRPYQVERKHRLSGAMVTFAKSRQEWDGNDGAQLTDEVWVDNDDSHRAITRYDYDHRTGNRTKIWKPEQWAANPDTLTNTNCTTFVYDDRMLFVVHETREPAGYSGQSMELEYEYEYGTGTKLVTRGPNAATCQPNCPPGTLMVEETRIRVDGFGRTIETWDTFSDDGTAFTPRKTGMTTYVDAAPSSVTEQTALQLNGGAIDYMKTETELDGHGRPIQTITYTFGSTPVDAVTTYQYRNDGTLAAVVVPDPTQNNASTVIYQYSFDSLGRPTNLVRPDNNSGVEISYNGLQQTTYEILGSGGGIPAATRTEKDSFGRLVRVSELVSDTPMETWATTTYAYDPLDNVTLVQDPEGVTTRLVHDFAGRRTEITRGHRTRSYVYDRNGNIVAQKTPCDDWPVCEERYTTTIAYDNLDRPTSKLIAPRNLSEDDIALFGAHHEEMVWDYPAGNQQGRMSFWRAYPTEAPQDATTWLDFSYDAQGNRIEAKQGYNAAGFHVDGWFYQGRNLAGLPVDSVYGDVFGGNVTRSSITYDLRGLPKAILLTASPRPPQYIAEQTRNVAGLVTQRRTDQPTVSAMPYIESQWSYDVLGRVTSQHIQKFGPTGLTTVALQELTYFDNDDPKTLVHALDGSSSSDWSFEFTYDARHQLKTVSEVTGAFVAEYQYSDAGRFTYAYHEAEELPGGDVRNREVEYHYNGDDPEQVAGLSGSMTAEYTYDEAGNLITRSYLDTDESWEFVYDGKDQLRRVVRTQNGDFVGKEEYWYDHEGQRIAVLKYDDSGSPTELITFNGDTEAHYDGSGALQYVYSHIAMGTPVARVKRTSSTQVEIEYQFHGLANNTLAAVDRDTGTINAGFIYAPFGELFEATGDIENHRRRMNDKFVDQLSELAYYGFRYYDKTSMTWTQSDPLYRFAPDAAWTEPRRAGLYTMTLNNPLTYVDPDGLMPRGGSAAAVLEGGLALSNATPHPVAKGVILVGTLVVAAAVTLGPEDVVKPIPWPQIDVHPVPPMPPPTEEPEPPHTTRTSPLPPVDTERDASPRGGDRGRTRKNPNPDKHPDRYRQRPDGRWERRRYKDDHWRPSGPPPPGHPDAPKSPNQQNSTSDKMRTKQAEQANHPDRTNVHGIYDRIDDMIRRSGIEDMRDMSRH